MPNWCANRLTVTGPAERIEAVRAAIAGEDSPLSFAAIVPQPAGLSSINDLAVSGEQLMAELFSPAPVSVQGWRILNWGTKWEPSGVGIDDDPDPERLVLRFDTAWSPAVPIAWRLIQDWPDLSFELLWAEQGEGVGGRTHGSDGTVEDQTAPVGGEREWFLAHGWDIWDLPPEDED